MLRLTVLRNSDGTYRVYDLNTCRTCYGRCRYATEAEALVGLRHEQRCDADVRQSQEHPYDD